MRIGNIYQGFDMKWTKLIYSFTRNKKEVENRISGKESSQFYSHACKIMANPKNQNVNHWIQEMLDFCDWIQDTKLKPNNKSIPKKMIEHFLEYGEDLNVLSKSLDRAYSNYHNGEKRKDKSNDLVLFNNYENFRKEVADKLDNKILDLGQLTILIQKYLIV